MRVSVRSACVRGRDEFFALAVFRALAAFRELRCSEREERDSPAPSPAALRLRDSRDGRAVRATLGVLALMRVVLRELSCDVVRFDVVFLFD